MDSRFDSGSERVNGILLSCAFNSFLIFGYPKVKLLTILLCRSAAKFDLPSFLYEEVMVDNSSWKGRCSRFHISLSPGITSREFENPVSLCYVSTDVLINGIVLFLSGVTKVLERLS